MIEKQQQLTKGVEYDLPVLCLGLLYFLQSLGLFPRSPSSALSLLSLSLVGLVCSAQLHR